MIQTTSTDAYFQEVYPTLGARQKIMLNALLEKENFTNTELAEYLNFPINTVTPRINELVKKKMVRESMIRECRVTGRRVIAWEIVCKGQPRLFI